MVVRGRWITPEEIPTETVCRVLLIPDEQEIRASVLGAISELIYPSNWEQVGAVTPQEISAAMDNMFWAFVESECQNVSVDIFSDQRAIDVDGGTITANTDTVAPFQTAYPDNAGIVTLASNQFIVPAGLYEYDIWHVVRGDAGFGAICWLYNATGASLLHEGLHVTPVANDDAILRCVGLLNLGTQQNIEFRVRSTDTLATTGLGLARNVTGHVEIYGQAVWRRLSD